MTVQELIDAASRYPEYVLGLFVGVPVLAWLMGVIHGRGGGHRGVWPYLYAPMIYLVCVPGMLAAVITAYTLFFTRANLLHVNFLVYFLPILSMVATLMIMSRTVEFERIPGFGRLSGMMVMIGITFIIVLFLYKTRIFVGFFGSIQHLLVIAVALYLGLQWASGRLLGKKD